MRCWTPLFTKNDLKTHRYEDNAKLHSAFSATMLSYATHFRQKQGVIENFKYLGEFEDNFCKCFLNCVLCLLMIERCKKKFKNRLCQSRACVPLKGWSREVRMSCAVRKVGRVRRTFVVFTHYPFLHS
jgi:hypothetical protein